MDPYRMFEDAELVSIGDIEQLSGVVLLEMGHDEIREVRDEDAFADIYDLENI